MLNFTDHTKLCTTYHVTITQRLDTSSGNIMLYIEDKESKLQCIRRVSKDFKYEEIEQIIKDWKQSIERDSN